MKQTMVRKLLTLALVVALLPLPIFGAAKTNLRLPFGCAGLNQDFKDWLGEYPPGSGTYYNGFHPGEDWHIPDGVVYPVATGTVIQSGPISGNRGWMIIIEHNNFYSEYTHVVPKSGIAVGTKITDLDRPIAVLATGMSLPTHLHWGIRTSYDISKEWYEGIKSNGYAASIMVLEERGFVDPSDYINDRIQSVSTVVRIDFKGNGGFFPPKTIKVKQGEVFEIPYAVPRRLGRICLGWSISKDAMEPDYTFGMCVAAPKDVNTLNLYAVWDAKAESFRDWLERVLKPGKAQAADHPTTEPPTRITEPPATAPPTQPVTQPPTQSPTAPPTQPPTQPSTDWKSIYSEAIRTSGWRYGLQYAVHDIDLDGTPELILFPESGGTAQDIYLYTIVNGALLELSDNLEGGDIYNPAPGILVIYKHSRNIQPDYIEQVKIQNNTIISREELHSFAPGKEISYTEVPPERVQTWTIN